MLSLQEVEEKLNFWSWPHHHWDATLGGVHLSFNPKTMIMTWIVMAVIVLFAVSATRNMDLRRPRGTQNVLEMIFEGIKNLVNQNMDPQKGANLLSIVVTFFIFILFSNMIGLIPTLSSPTADYNTTFALSLTTFALIYIFGIRYKGAGYFKHYFQPYVFFLPINLIEDLSKPITLAFRLYGNIYGGEVLIAVLLGLLTGWVDVCGGFIASVVWLSFSIFVGFIQAFIFTMLSIAYVSQATAENH